MKKIILMFLLAIDVLALIAYAVCSLFLIRFNASLGVTTDGFGRILTRAPLLLRYTGIVEEWAGFGWFVIDTVCLIILIIIADLLFRKITGRE